MEAFRIFRFRLVFAAVLVPLFLCLATATAQTPRKLYSVQVSANVQASPPRINLVWPPDPNAVGYAVFRKTKEAASWKSVANLSGSATSFSDSNVSDGDGFEYKIHKTTSGNYTGYGYIFAGINYPMIDSRGRLILVVENTFAGELAFELQRLQQDLVGDGWTVIRYDVNRSDSVTGVKALIKSAYDADPSNTKAVFLFGRVPVPYSGNIFPDGHANHQGAWPADVYYGDMTGTWTDNTVASTVAESQRNWNIPGDGKFDQSEPPADVTLQVGRVDLSNMTSFSNQSGRSEKDLLRQYLNKDHDFRYGLLPVERRGFLTDDFSNTDFDPAAGSGWRNLSAFFGANLVTEGEFGTYFPTLISQSYLWSYGAGGGQYVTCYGVGTSDDFALQDPKVVFTMLMGSKFGDWDVESSILRAPLGTTTYTLTCSYSGAPQTLYHHMALGENIGYSIRLTQNNETNGLYVAGQGSHQVHIALMGDPSLRMHAVIPPVNLLATAGTKITLSWQPSTDSSIQGYHVYRATSAAGPFARLTSSVVSSTTYHDSPPPGTYTYMVRAVKLEQTGSGTYFNPSQGVFATVVSTNGSSTNLPPPGAQAMANLNYLFKTSFTNDGIAPGARGTIYGKFTRRGNIVTQRLKVSGAGLDPESGYQLSILSEPDRTTPVSDFTTHRSGTFKLVYTKKGEGDLHPGGQLLPESLNPLCQLGTLGILNTNSQIVLRADFFLPETMNYNVKCNLINTGFNPRAAAVLRLRATQRIFQSSLKGAGLTANASYQLLINDIVAQTFSADSKGKFNLKSLVTERAAVLGINSVAIVDAVGSNTVLTAEGLGIPCSSGNP